MFIGTLYLGFIALAAIVADQNAADVRPGLLAAEGKGTIGYYVPRSRECGKGCTWYGEFRLPSGTVTRKDVTLNDASPSSLYTRVPVPAQDTGDSGAVYPRPDAAAWGGAATWTVMGLGWLVVLVVPLIVTGTRRLRRVPFP